MIEFHYVVGSDKVEIHVADQPVQVVSFDELDAAIDDLYAQERRAQQ